MLSFYLMFDNGPCTQLLHSEAELSTWILALNSEQKSDIVIQIEFMKRNSDIRAYEQNLRGHIYKLPNSNSRLGK